MNIEVYCDESRPDLFASAHPPAQFMLIGSLWLQADHREQIKKTIHALRDKHKIGGEFKWQKVSPSRTLFYQELIDCFLSFGDVLRFRCIAVDHDKVNLVHYHDNDQELGFYKFYYQMLRHWLDDFNKYAVFCDCKRNRDPRRLAVLRQCLDASILSSTVLRVQAIRSNESVLIQLADVLTGIAAARLNQSLRAGSAKELLVQTFENHMGHPIRHTRKAEQKYNVFVIDLQGGW
jgi:hypothetical protein